MAEGEPKCYRVHNVEVKATIEQRAYLRHHLHGTVEMYNLFRELQQQVENDFKTGIRDKRMTKNELFRMARSYRNQDRFKHFYGMFDKAALNNTMDVFWDALDRWFKAIVKWKGGGSKGEPPTYPRLKHLNKTHSLRLFHARTPPKVIEGGWGIALPAKLGGNYRLMERLRFNQPIRMITARIRLGRVWFAVMFGLDELPKTFSPPRRKIGIDLGARSSMGWNGEEHVLIGKEMDKLTLKQRDEVRAVQRALSRKHGRWDEVTKKSQRPSRNWWKLSRHLNKLHKHHDDQRKQLRSKMVDELLSGYDEIVLQRDNLSAFCRRKKAKNNSNARLIQTSPTYSRMGWGYFLTELKRACEENGLIFTELSRWLPMSMLCHACGHKNSRKTAGIHNARITCEKGCDEVTDYCRNMNSSKVIFNYDEKTGCLTTLNNGVIDVPS